MRIKIVLLLCIFIMGCAKTGPIPRDQVEGIKKIGIISLLGNEIKFRYFGPTIIDTFSSFLDLGFELDQMVVKEIGDQISMNTNISVIDVPYESSKLEKVYEAHKGIDGDYESVGPIKEELSDIVQEHSLDAIVLVIKIQTPDSNFHHVKGFGVLAQNILVYKACHSHMYAWALIIDGKTLETLTHFSFFETFKLANEYCPDENYNFTSKQKNYISSWFKDESKKAINNGMKEIGLN